MAVFGSKPEMNTQMASYNFIISLNLPYYLKHGRSFITQFLASTSDNCKLFIYNENSFDVGVQPDYHDMNLDFCSHRIEFRDLWKCTNVGEWQAKCIPVQEAKSGLPVVFDPHQRLEQRKKGYDYRFDALAHSKAMFAQKHLLSTLNDGDNIIFLDVDVVFLKKLGDDFFNKLSKPNDLQYLGRKSQHSETGYFSYVKNDNVVQFYNDIVDYYMSLRVFSLPHWTDSHLFDHVRSTNKNVNFINISQIDDGHVFINSFLGLYFDHLKGGRKLDGRSPANEYHKFKKPESELTIPSQAKIDAISAAIKRPPGEIKDIFSRYLDLHMIMPYSQKMPRDNLLMINKFIKFIDPTVKTVGDFGCMSGWIGYVLKTKLNDSIEYHGFDISKEMLEAGALRYPYFKFTHLDINGELPGPFDLVWSSQIIMPFTNMTVFVERLFAVTAKTLYYVWPHHDQDEKIFSDFMRTKYGSNIVVCQRAGRFDVLILRK